MTDERIIRAEKAARILDDVKPYLARLETQAFEDAVGADRTTEAGKAKAEDELRFVTAIRRLKSVIEMDVTIGKQHAKREAQKDNLP